MMTSDERRAIAARADEVTFDMGSDVRDVMRGLLHVLGVESERVSMWCTDGHHALARIRELCELPDESEEYKRGFDEGFNAADDWYVEKGDEELAAHGLLRAPRDADGAPILPGDLVTHPDMDGVREVTQVAIGINKECVCCMGGFEAIGTSSMRHVRDTPELVANDLDELAKYMSLVDDGEAHDRLASLAERLREMKGDAR